MNVINDAMLYLLNSLHALVGSYGLAIVLLTVGIRLALWPLNSAQTRATRKMQELQPKLKALQAKHKDNPQKLQEAMMKFYSEHSFNPMAGCLPMLVQLPIFFGLYGALSSPHFLVQTVDEKFLFLNSLSNTLHTTAGKALDGIFEVNQDDTFSTDTTLTLTMNDGSQRTQNVTDTQNIITLFPKPLLPGQPVTMTLDFTKMGLSDDYKTLVKSADVLVVNNHSRELERIHFENQDGRLTQKVETTPTGINSWLEGFLGGFSRNWDILVLIIIYGVLTMLYSKVMQIRQPAADPNDPAAAALNNPMMKMMPLMFSVMLLFIPIPAGAMIYLVVTTALMFIQTVWVNWSEDRKEAAQSRPGEQVVDIKADRA